MDRKTKKLLLEFHLEIYKIWESWHVMDQRNVFGLFQISIWPEIKAGSDIELDSKIAECLKHFEEYNDTMQDYKEFQDVYNSDIKNKTVENGKILHSKRETVTEKLRSLQQYIDPLRELVEKQLIELKVLK